MGDIIEAGVTAAAGTPVLGGEAGTSGGAAVVHSTPSLAQVFLGRMTINEQPSVSLRDEERVHCRHIHSRSDCSTRQEVFFYLISR